MKKAQIKFLLLAFVLAIQTSVGFASAYTNVDKYQENLVLAKNFLVNTQYNPSVEMAKESPYLMKNRYGIQSDNYIMSKALEEDFPTISDTVYDRIVELGYTGNCKYESIVSNKVFSLPFVTQDFRAIYNNTLGSDDFNRDPLGANWTATDGSWAIINNWLNGSGGKEILYYNVEQASDADITVRMNLTSGSYFGVVLRYENNTDFVVCWLNTVDGGQAILQKVENGVYSTVDKVAYPISLGQVYEVRFELLEDLHRLWIDDFSEGAEPVLQGNTSISQNSGYAGVMIDSGTVAVFDDFEFVDYRIYNAFDTETTQDNYEEYNDLCFVASAIRYNQRNVTEANRLFEKGLSYWDGYGFNDTHMVVGAYMTYQLALCLTVSNKIHYNLGDLGATMEAILWGLQTESGGITTHYLDTLEGYGIGEPNTETTSMAILAYASARAKINFDISLILYIVVGIVFGSIIVNIIKKR
jgi:hypothetical protein